MGRTMGPIHDRTIPMHVAIDASDVRPIYLQIVAEVRRALVLGTLEPGAALPSIRQLAAELRVNPNTVAQAYGELERDGVVYVQRGLGTFVSPEVRPGDEERRALARAVAERALADAHRNGVGAEDLVEAVRELAEDRADVATGSSGADAAR